MLCFKNLLLFIVFLIGCKPVEFRQGKVINKEFIAAHHEKIPTIQPSFGIGWDGKPKTSWNIVQKIILIPDQFLITIVREGEQEKIYLSKEEYDSFNLGDHYPHFEKP
jgi:hypothetical protein